MPPRKRITRSSAAPIPATSKASTNAGADPAGGKKPALREAAAPTAKVAGTLMGWLEKRPREPKEEPMEVEPKIAPVFKKAPASKKKMTEVKDAGSEKVPEVAKDGDGAEPVAPEPAEPEPQVQPAVAVEAEKPVAVEQPETPPLTISVLDKSSKSEMPKVCKNVVLNAPGQTNMQYLQAYKLQSKIPVELLEGFEASLVATEAAKGASLTEPSGPKHLHFDDLDPASVQEALNDLQKNASTDKMTPSPSAELVDLETANTATTSKAGEKRPYDTGVDKGSDGEDDSDAEMEKCPWNCNQIRTKIHAFLDSGEMKVTEFQKTIGANSNSYGRFMKLKGPWKGDSNNTFYGACKFFMKREKEGIKPAKKQKTGEAALPDISNITLDKEEEDEVEVYDTCDELRKKISAHLINTGVSKTSLCKAFAAQLHTRGNASIQIKQLNDFRGKKGADAGNTSSVFYGGCVYFEKLRIAEGKPKSAFRVQMEKEWGEHGGFNTTHSSSRGIWMSKDENVSMDKYGKLKFWKK